MERHPPPGHAEAATPRPEDAPHQGSSVAAVHGIGRPAASPLVPDGRAHPGRATSDRGRRAGRTCIPSPPGSNRLARRHAPGDRGVLLRAGDRGGGDPVPGRPRGDRRRGPALVPVLAQRVPQRAGVGLPDDTARRTTDGEPRLGGAERGVLARVRQHRDRPEGRAGRCPRAGCHPDVSRRGPSDVPPERLGARGRGLRAVGADDVVLLARPARPAGGPRGPARRRRAPGVRVRRGRTHRWTMAFRRRSRGHDRGADGLLHRGPRWRSSSWS